MFDLFRFFLSMLRFFWQLWLAGVLWLWRWFIWVMRRRGEIPATLESAATPIEREASDTHVPRASCPHGSQSALAGQFIAGTFTHGTGKLDYKLYVPPATNALDSPMVVMLHGCKQNPDDFSIGSRMNELAQHHNCLVLYPAQSHQANRLLCWNWFNRHNQERECGEPAILAGMVREVGALHGANPGRIYVAGLSAGAAMAVTLAHTYPELFAAVGSHSGLPYAAATNMMGALIVMKRGVSVRTATPVHAAARGGTTGLPLIVFQGDQDRTVHPRNAMNLLAQSGCLAVGDERGDQPAQGNSFCVVEQGHVPAGRTYTRTLYRDADGVVRAEYWLVHGAGHAWSGGNAEGSYTDPLGPDASAEFLRFFLSHAHGIQSSAPLTAPTSPVLATA